MRSAWSMTFRAMALFGLASAARPDARATVLSPGAGGSVIYREGAFLAGGDSQDKRPVGRRGRGGPIAPTNRVMIATERGVLR